MPEPTAAHEEQVLQAARARRERLRAAMTALEEAAAAAHPGREVGWRDRVRRVAAELRATWIEHVAETEADDGSFEQVLGVAPRLRSTVDRLRADHDEVVPEIDRLVALAEGEGEPAAMREAALSLFSRLASHRQLGADLLFEAYNVDIGPAD